MDKQYISVTILYWQSNIIISRDLRLPTLYLPHKWLKPTYPSHPQFKSRLNFTE